MSLPKMISVEFVETAPGVREAGVFYVSIPYRTIIHNCLCGCGSKIVTPIRPNKWVMTYDGDTISLSPSVGNWSYPCQSHYVIRKNKVLPAGPMNTQKIAEGRNHDRALSDRYYSPDLVVDEAFQEASRAKPLSPEPASAKKRGIIAWLLGR